MRQNKIESLLGLCTRSRNLVSGEFAAEAAVKDGSAALVIVATDASANTKKLFRDKCSFSKHHLCLGFCMVHTDSAL